MSRTRSRARGGPRALAFACTLLLGLLTAPQGHAQGSFGVRLTPCVGTTVIVNLCNVSAFVQTPEVGAFVQTRPVAGAPWDNFNITIYRPLDQVSFAGFLIQTQPGLTVSRERGAWIIGVTADIILGGSWGYGRGEVERP